MLGDDLALDAQPVTGVASERELPVVWAVGRGSLVDKLILVPAALPISAVAPWAVAPPLMVGGAFLCLEGFEKLAQRWLHRDEVEAHRAEWARALEALAMTVGVYGLVAGIVKLDELGLWLSRRSAGARSGGGRAPPARRRGLSANARQGFDSIPSSSTSNCSTAFGGMGPPGVPRSP